MAKIVSPVWSSARGSIAGTTYLTTAAGQIIARQRTKPTNAPSVMRNFIKGALSYAAQQWSAISAVYRTAWDNWAVANTTQTGRQVFMGAQTLHKFANDSGPAGWTSPAINLVAPDFSGHPSVTLTPKSYTSASSTGVKMEVGNFSPHTVSTLLEISPPQSVTTNFYKGPWDTTKTAGVTCTASTSQGVWFSGLTGGQRYFVQARGMTSGTGAAHSGTVLSAHVIASATAVTNT